MEASQWVQGQDWGRACLQLVPSCKLAIPSLSLLHLLLTISMSSYSPSFSSVQLALPFCPHSPEAPGTHTPAPSGLLFTHPPLSRETPVRNLWNVPRKPYHGPDPIALSTQEGKHRGKKKKKTKSWERGGKQAVRTPHFFPACPGVCQTVQPSSTAAHRNRMFLSGTLRGSRDS